ncbi:hypothetical protein KR018_008102 [Drosophila ironensis]|nr:hypothetical protein KR018_008102 [Drosophila ironensis]
MSLGRALWGLAPMNLLSSRNFHRRCYRKPFFKFPERRIRPPIDNKKPPRLLVKSFKALHNIQTSFTRDGSIAYEDQFPTKWKW